MAKMISLVSEYHHPSLMHLWRSGQPLLY